MFTEILEKLFTLENYYWALWIAIVVYAFLAITKKFTVDKLLKDVFFINLFIFVPPLIVRDGWNVIVSLTNFVLRMFAIEYGIEEFLAIIKNLEPAMMHFNIMALVSYMVSPIVAGAFILSFIKDKLKSLLISLSFKRNVYVFSSLNERAVCLAKSIGKNGKIIILEDEKSEKTELKEECRTNNFMLIDYSAYRVYKKVRSHILNITPFKKEISLFFIDSDEDVALNKMIDFTEKQINKKTRMKTWVYLFSVSSEAEFVVDNYKIKAENQSKSFILRLVDNAQLVSYQILEEFPLYSVNSKNFTVTVLGAGNIGSHIVKDIIWCGALPGGSLQVNVVDVNIDRVKDEFSYKYPEINKENYDINFFSANALGGEFDTLLKEKFATSDYFVVATGNDKINILASQNIRAKFFRYHRKLPHITAVIRDDSKAHAARNVFDALRINIAGNESKLFSLKAVKENDIFQKAYLVDKTYNECKGYDVKIFEEFLNSDESTIRSNVSFALHIPYKIWALTGINPDNAKKGTPEFKAIEDYFKNEEPKMAEKIDEHEHIRWMAFQHSEGVVSPFGKTSFETEEEAGKAMEELRALNEKTIGLGYDYLQNKNKPALHKSLFSKQHGCIIDYEYLDLLAEKMVKADGKKPNFKDYDSTLDREMFNIWKEYNK